MPPLRSYVPRGAGLPEARWRLRHRLVCAVLALHLVILVGYGLLARTPDGPASVGTGFVALALAVALAPLNRRTRALAATLGLLLCSATL
ncbi:MAG: two-component system, OmpR family, sensor kinase, partial [Frankiales bacterium]|nr:two-component system, OmpR family, sensor kinase [Frankiales bacterium]